MFSFQLENLQAFYTTIPIALSLVVTLGWQLIARKFAHLDDGTRLERQSVKDKRAQIKKWGANSLGLSGGTTMLALFFLLFTGSVWAAIAVFLTLLLALLCFAQLFYVTFFRDGGSKESAIINGIIYIVIAIAISIIAIIAVNPLL